MALALLLARLLLVAAVATAASGVPVPSGYAGLAVGFYKESCPHAEELVLAEMREIVREDPTLGPALLRFMLHDCFVRGCDGSIMLKSRNGTGERNAFPSYSLRGYDEIDQIKTKLEAECPLTVSCADIIVMAARDAVFLVTGFPSVPVKRRMRSWNRGRRDWCSLCVPGSSMTIINKRRLLHSFFQSNGPWYPVETGRRDGRVSFEYDANNDVPGPNNTIVDLKIYFSFKGLGWKDIVVLSGSHTIGRAQCSTFAGDRLYNYTGRGVQDPTLNKTYAAELRSLCEPGLGDDRSMVEMDPTSPCTFDLGYYRDVLNKRGLFSSDQTLMDDRWTREYVERMAAAESPDEFFRDYAEAMTNMGRIEVLTGHNGEIRKTCTAYVD